jgi:aldehyde dehydrogenase (NAD+)
MLPAEIDRERPGFFLRSAVLADVHNDMQVAKEEIFGHVACILSFETEEEAVCMTNDSPRARWLRS